MLLGLSCIPDHPPPAIAPEVVAQSLEIHFHPPPGLNRIPGLLTILYYLHQDEALKASGVHLPTSTSTVWKILKEHGCLPPKQPVDHRPLDRPQPMSSWGIDFKSVSSVPPEPDGKQQHVVEEGTSSVVAAQPDDDYHAGRVLYILAGTFLLHGLPDEIRFDRDPRFVGSADSREFPPAFTRFLLCLGITVHVSPPHRPDKNPYAERWIGSYERECLQIHRPTNLVECCAVTDEYVQFYNHERPNQALSCGNRPPFTAFLTLPCCPRLPDRIDPDRWLLAVHNRVYKRRVEANGSVQVDRQKYYVSRRLRGCYVLIRVDAHQQTFHVEVDGREIKVLLIKGLFHGEIDLVDYLEIMQQQAESEWRKARRRRRWHSRISSSAPDDTRLSNSRG